MNETTHSGYGKLREEKEYLKLLGAGVISRFGDSVDAIAYSWMVYQITGSPVWLSIIFGVNALPTILFQPFAGVWLDYLDKKKVMVACDLGRGLIVGLTGLLFITGRLSPWLIMALTFLNSTLESFRTPAGVAIVPSVLKRENYEYGMGLKSTLSRTFEIAGTMSAPVIIGLLGLGGALLIDALTFLLSGFVLLFIRVPKEERRTSSANSGTYWESMREGLHYFRTRHVVLAICLMGCFINALAVPIGSLLTAFTKDYLHLGVEALTVAGLGSSIFMGLGALGFPWLRKYFNSFTLVKMGLAGLALVYGLLSMIGHLPDPYSRVIALGAVMGLLGLSITMISMVVSVSFMLHVERPYLGRISALFNSMAMGITPLASFALAPMVTVLPIDRLYAIMGILMVVLTIGVALSKTLKRLDQPESEETHGDSLVQQASLSQ